MRRLVERVHGDQSVLELGRRVALDRLAIAVDAVDIATADVLARRLLADDRASIDLLVDLALRRICRRRIIETFLARKDAACRNRACRGAIMLAGSQALAAVRAPPAPARLGHGATAIKNSGLRAAVGASVDRPAASGVCGQRRTLACIWTGWWLFDPPVSENHSLPVTGFNQP